MDQATWTDSQGVVRVDRRVNRTLRAMFEQAYEVIHPFFEPGNSWGGQRLEHLAFRTLREHFPALGMQEVEEVVAAAHRVYTTRHLPNGRSPFARSQPRRSGAILD